MTSDQLPVSGALSTGPISLADASCIVLRLDGRGRVIFLNSFGLDFFGYQEEEVQQCHDRYRLFSEASTEGILFHDNGIAIEANDAFANLVAYPRVQLIGMNIIRHFVSSQDKGQGTGLGLASTYGIVKNHKGYLEAAQDENP